MTETQTSLILLLVIPFKLKDSNSLILNSIQPSKIIANILLQLIRVCDKNPLHTARNRDQDLNFSLSRKNSPVLAPEPELLDLTGPLPLLQRLEAFKCWICISKQHPANIFEAKYKHLRSKNLHINVSEKVL